MNYSNFFLILQKKNYLKFKYNYKFYQNSFFFNFNNNNKSNFNNFNFNNFFFFFIKTYSINFFNFNFFNFNFFNFNFFNFNFFLNFKKTFGDGFFFIKSLFLIFLIDSSISDDEPIWEPLEWTLIQTWIFFIFLFAWVAENLITSRYGSYTGRDKRVWLGWYRTFWLVELWYLISYGAACLFVIVPFYYELTYNISFVFSWWNWYNKLFFFKFIFFFSIIIYIGLLIQINNRWINWKKNLILILFINLILGYLLYINFIIAFFSYFTDPLWYQKTRTIDYIQLSHEPLKWGWGAAKRDHFSYHKVSTVFWFKNDSPFAAAFLMIHFFFFLSIFFLWLYWLILFRKTFYLKELTYTYLSYSISSLKQFFFFFFFLFLLVLISFLINYWRFPIEFLWIINYNSWFYVFFNIIFNYFQIF